MACCPTTRATATRNASAARCANRRRGGRRCRGRRPARRTSSSSSSTISGFSDFGCFGAEILTPAHRCARRRRLALFAVHHGADVHAGTRGAADREEPARGRLRLADVQFPGLSRAIEPARSTRDAPTLAELLRMHGYSTYAVGKWHNTAEYNVTPAADRASWPLQRGFDRFYGFIGGETHYFAPAQLVEDNAIVDRDAYPADYYCSDDWTDTAIRWLTAHVGASPDKPFLPVSALQRAARAVARQVRGSRPLLGRVRRGLGRACARHASNVSARWAFMRATGSCRRAVPAFPRGPTSRRGAARIFARYMELYAAIVDNIDQNVGRLRSFLATIGRLDNTLDHRHVGQRRQRHRRRRRRGEQSRQAACAQRRSRTSCAGRWRAAGSARRKRGRPIRSAGRTCPRRRSGSTRRRR